MSSGGISAKRRPVPVFSPAKTTAQNIVKTPCLYISSSRKLSGVETSYEGQKRKPVIDPKQLGHEKPDRASQGYCNPG